MSKIRVQCTLDEVVWVRIDALQLTPRGGSGRGGSQQARRELDLAALVMKGLAAIEAEEAAKDTDRTPATPATPRTDVPSWLREAPPAEPAPKP